MTPPYRMLHNADYHLTQEFSIEIPDAEADEIKTVQQGLVPICRFVLAVYSSSVVASFP